MDWIGLLSYPTRARYVVRRLPIGPLKIDRSFVFQLESENGDEKSQRIVRAIMNLGDGLHADVIAKGSRTGSSS